MNTVTLSPPMMCALMYPLERMPYAIKEVRLYADYITTDTRTLEAYFRLACVVDLVHHHPRGYKQLVCDLDTNNPLIEMFGYNPSALLGHGKNGVYSTFRGRPASQLTVSNIRAIRAELEAKAMEKYYANSFIHRPQAVPEL